MKTYKAYAKVNIFLKITGTRGDYHEIISRFMRVESLYDELSFVKKNTKEFQILGNFSCETKDNTIYKGYKALLKATNSTKLITFMENYALKVDKSIPAFAGLGGGSSDCATYLKMCNEVLELGLSVEQLAKIGLEVGADVPFFIYDYNSANVSGIGEVVEEFKEELLNFKVTTPNIKISTPKVYTTYRKDFFSPITQNEAEKLKMMSSLEVLNSYKIDEVNDLYKPALKEYSNLKQEYQDGWFFSGSGSSFFTLTEV